MARGKFSQPKPVQQVSNSPAQPLGLAPPPGLPAPTSSSRKKAAKQLAGVDALQPGLVRPPGLESIAEDATTPIEADAAEDAETSSTTSPMYIDSSIGERESTWESVGELEAISSEMYQVQLSGLPNEILCGAMFEVVLQQGRLKGFYSSYSTTPGESSGEALISLPTESAAEWCVHHFRSCSWGVRGTMLGAEIVSRPTCEQACEIFEDCLYDSLASFQPGPLFQEGDLLEAVPDDSDVITTSLYADSERQSARLSSDAPAFVPGLFSVEAPEFVMSAMLGGLSAEAHEFVPGQLTEKILALSSKLTNTSDVSTVDGESDTDSEKKDGNANEAAAR